MATVEVSGKSWFSDNIYPFLEIIKSDINARMSQLGGAYLGTSTTYSTLPDPVGKNDGDWSILSEVDGSNDVGMYIIVSESWTFAIAFSDTEKASLEDWDAGDDIKFITASMAKLKLAQIDGNSAIKFNVNEADENSTNAVSASMFNHIISNSDADSHWEEV